MLSVRQVVVVVFTACVDDISLSDRVLTGLCCGRWQLKDAKRQFVWVEKGE